MEEELENCCGVLDYQKPLKVVDQIVTLGPHKARDEVMNANRKNVLIVGSVEDHGSPLWQERVGALARGSRVRVPRVSVA